MNIQQLSANIDEKLAQLDRQINALQKLKPSTENPEQNAADIEALEQLRRKLLKSRDIAWRAHKLQKDGDEKLMRQKRWLGIGLCLISGIGLLAIAGTIFLR